MDDDYEQFKLKHVNDFKRVLKTIEETKNLNDYLQNMEAEKRERDHARSIEFDNLREKGYSKSDRNGQKITYWQELAEIAASLTNKPVNSYNDWRSAMMNLLNINYLRMKAMSHEIDKITFNLKVFALDNVVPFIKNSILINLIGLPEKDLPTLMHQVDLNDDGQLVVNLWESNRRKNNPKLDENTAKLDNLFKLGITLWLNELGYKPDPNNKDKFKHQPTKKYLDKTTFNELKKNPDYGLNVFLSQNYNLKFQSSNEEENSYSLSPSP